MELVIGGGLDGAVLGEGADDLDGFLELGFRHLCVVFAQSSVIEPNSIVVYAYLCLWGWESLYGSKGEIENLNCWGGSGYLLAWPVIRLDAIRLDQTSCITDAVLVGGAWIWIGAIGRRKGVHRLRETNKTPSARMIVCEKGRGRCLHLHARPRAMS